MTAVTIEAMRGARHKQQFRDKDGKLVVLLPTCSPTKSTFVKA